MEKFEKMGNLENLKTLKPYEPVKANLIILKEDMIRTSDGDGVPEETKDWIDTW